MKLNGVKEMLDNISYSLEENRLKEAVKTVTKNESIITKKPEMVKAYCINCNKNFEVEKETIESSLLTNQDPRGIRLICSKKCLMNILK